MSVTLHTSLGDYAIVHCNDCGNELVARGCTDVERARGHAHCRDDWTVAQGDAPAGAKDYCPSCVLPGLPLAR